MLRNTLHGLHYLSNHNYMGKVLLWFLLHRDENSGLEKLKNLPKVTQSGFGTSLTWTHMHSQACSYSYEQDIVIRVYRETEYLLSLSSYLGLFIISHVTEGGNTEGQNHPGVLSELFQASFLSVQPSPKARGLATWERETWRLLWPQNRTHWKTKLFWDHDYNFTYLETTWY